MGYNTMDVIGLDIGGANIKAVKVSYHLGDTHVVHIVREYFPIWIKGIDGLRKKLREIKDRICSNCLNYFVGTCMTAELSDIFPTKDIGVKSVVNVVEDVFSDAIRRFYVTYDMNLVDLSKLYSNPLSVAAANWAASAWLLEKLIAVQGYTNAFFIDIGSTTTTIIPLVNGKTLVRGKTDPEKLLYGELVYIGTLRTDVSSIVDKVPFKGFYISICREKFALAGDVQLILGYIESSDYTTETADGRGKTLDEALARISRIVCSDIDVLNQYEIKEIARYVYEVQVNKVFNAIIQIRSWLASIGIDLENFVAIVAGIGKHIATEASRRAGFKKIIDIDNILGKPLASVIPAYGAALMVIEAVKKNGFSGA